MRVMLVAPYVSTIRKVITNWPICIETQNLIVAVVTVPFVTASLLG